MGTRSLTFVKEAGEVVINMYRQMDGYPSGHGRDLYEFLKDIVMVNGLGFGEKRKVANGMGCLAAQLVGHFKGGEAGGIYLYPANMTDCGQEYEYTVSGGFDRKELTVTVRECCGEKSVELFEGSVKEFGTWLELEQEAA